MQNVYLVISENYEEQMVWGVFSSEERANQAVKEITKRYNTFRPFDLSIVETQLDQIDPF